MTAEADLFSNLESPYSDVLVLPGALPQVWYPIVMAESMVHQYMQACS